MIAIARPEQVTSLILDGISLYGQAEQQDLLANYLPRVVIVGGGLLIEAQGAILGAIGVSGAPGGDADDACAKAGITAIRDKIDF